PEDGDERVVRRLLGDLREFGAAEVGETGPAPSDLEPCGAHEQVAQARDRIRVLRAERVQPRLRFGVEQHQRHLSVGVGLRPVLTSTIRAVKLGALVWPQYTDWESLRETGALVDRLGYDSLWTWDHLYPIVGDPEGPIFEGYLTLAGWAEHTENVRLGLMVGANTFRNPGLVVKMI